MGRVDNRYLGDGVYASFDGFQAKLTTEPNIPNTIYIDRYVAKTLIAYLVEIDLLPPFDKGSPSADLLAALAEFVEQAESYCTSTGHKQEGAAMFGACDAICAAIPAGRAAIAKAKGGAQ